MKDGNTTLSPAAQAAIERIKTLRAVTQKTGIQTINAQVDTLLALPNEDCLAVADALNMRGAR